MAIGETVRRPLAATWCRRLKVLGDETVALLRWAKFAGLVGIFKRPPTMALEAEGIDEYAARIGPRRVASVDALLAPMHGAPRLWLPPAPAAVPETARVMAAHDSKQPWFAKAPPADRPTQQAFLRLPRAIVYPRPGFVMTAPGKVMRGSQLRWVPDHRLTPGFAGFADGRLVANTAALRPMARMRRPVLALCHPFYANYGHWLFDCLPFLLPWREALLDGRLSLLTAPLAQWQRRTLALLGVPASAVCEAREASVLCDDLIVPLLRPTADEPLQQPRSFRLPQPGQHVIQAIETLRCNIAGAAATDAPERIYISRRGIESFRHMRNEDEVETAMTRLGFTIVRPQELDFDRQVATFARARVVAGPHGAGMTNAAFAPAGCLVLDILPKAWSSRWVVRLTLLFGHHYLPITFPMDNVTAKRISFDDAEIGAPQFYRADTDKLNAILLRAMRDLGVEGAGVSNA